MARNRTKSFNDIDNQADRLKNELGNQLEKARRSGDHGRWRELYGRYRKVLDAANRYTDNIIKQKADQNAVQKADDLQRKGLYIESMEVAKKANNRQWSQATYMGNSNG